MTTMVCGKLRKFQSSIGIGGERFRGKKLNPTKSIADAKDEIVAKLRERAEKYEVEAEHALPGKSAAYSLVAEELRACATSIRLNDWNDMREP